MYGNVNRTLLLEVQAEIIMPERTRKGGQLTFS